MYARTCRVFLYMALLLVPDKAAVGTKKRNSTYARVLSHDVVTELESWCSAMQSNRIPPDSKVGVPPFKADMGAPLRSIDISPPFKPLYWYTSWLPLGRLL